MSHKICLLYCTFKDTSKLHFLRDDFNLYFIKTTINIGGSAFNSTVFHGIKRLICYKWLVKN